MTSWQEMAAQAIADGYSPGNPYEENLRASLDPAKAQELGEDLEPWLQVTTADALKLADEMMEAGEPPELALEAAKEQLSQAAQPDEG